MTRLTTCLCVVLGLAGFSRAGDDLGKEEKQLIELVNAERKKADLPPLRVDMTLMKAARGHSANMAAKGELAHTLDCKGPGERLKDAGYASFGWGENCAAGQRTPAEAMASWMNSEGHRANLLGKDYREIGVALVKAADGTIYWTQVFAVPAK
jgi:uncharacterized protein YkwD